MRVNITKGFKIAIDGIHVIDVEPGEQDLHEQAANWAMKNGHGQAAKEAKAAEKAGTSLEKLSVKKLKALATEKGIELDANETKDDLIAKITVADSDADAEAEKAAGKG